MNNRNVQRYFKKNILPPDGFIYRDIQREIDLARAGNSGGDFLAALGLLCYTEFMGSIVTKGEGSYTKQFKTFLRFMGEEYRKLIDEKQLDVYRVFRSGLVHAYFAGECVIKMLNDNYAAGIIIKPDGKYLFIVEKYFQDFMTACNGLYSSMASDKNPYLPSA